MPKKKETGEMAAFQSLMRLETTSSDRLTTKMMTIQTPTTCTTNNASINDNRSVHTFRISFGAACAWSAMPFNPILDSKFNAPFSVTAHLVVPAVWFTTYIV